jgi:hypothetical protein
MKNAAENLRNPRNLRFQTFVLFSIPSALRGLLLIANKRRTEVR